MSAELELEQIERDMAFIEATCQFVKAKWGHRGEVDLREPRKVWQEYRERRRALSAEIEGCAEGEPPER